MNIVAADRTNELYTANSDTKSIIMKVRIFNNCRWSQNFQHMSFNRWCVELAAITYGIAENKYPYHILITDEYRCCRQDKLIIYCCFWYAMHYNESQDLQHVTCIFTSYTMGNPLSILRDYKIKALSKWWVCWQNVW